MTCPIKTRSGYGDRARDIARAILKADKYDLKIWNINWGITPFNGLDPNDPSDKAILDCVMVEPTLPRKPEIHIHVSVPNEFQPVGVYNIGVTAGIETNVVDASWIEGANRMDITLVSSEHAKQGFLNAVYEQRDHAGNVVNILRLNKPMEVLFEGLDVDTFFKTDTIEPNVKSLLSEVKEDWAFLFCGHWLSGIIGQDRKDVGMLIKVFYETFKNKKKKPALILKTSAAGMSITDRKTILEKIESIRKSCDSTDLPNVYLIHGNLTRSEMNSLYNHPKVKAHVSFTKGEGFGRPILEASVSAKPILLPKHSGYVDFMEHAIWLPGGLTDIHPSAQYQGMLNANTKWFTVDYGMAGGLMEKTYESYKSVADLGKRQAYKSRTEFTLDKMQTKLLTYIEAALNTIPKPVELKLPTLRKVEIPKESVDGK